MSLPPSAPPKNPWPPALSTLRSLSLAHPLSHIPTPPPRRSPYLTTRNTTSTRTSPPSQAAGIAHTLSQNPTSLRVITKYRQAHIPHLPHTRTSMPQPRRRLRTYNSPPLVRIFLHTDSPHAPRRRTAAGLATAPLFDTRRPLAK